VRFPNSAWSGVARRDERELALATQLAIGDNLRWPIDEWVTLAPSGDDQDHGVRARLKFR
jgi:hypothetical protein